jgi:phosphate transport system protein
MSEHLLKQFDSELDDVRARLTRMGGLVEEQVRDAIRALAELDRDLAETVVVRDAGVDEMEISLDDALTLVVARQQPAAIDLRVLMAVSKTVTDLERIGDEAKKVAKATRKIYDRGIAVGTPQTVAVQHMGEKVAAMLHAVLDAFVRSDVAAATRVVREDKEIDRHFGTITRELVTYMMEDPRTISSALDIIFIVKSIERIGDHCKNIAKDVIYIVKGRDVRHLSLEALEEETRAQ